MCDSVQKTPAKLKCSEIEMPQNRKILMQQKFHVLQYLRCNCKVEYE